VNGIATRAAVAASACLAVLAFASVPAHAALPGSLGKIAYMSDSSGNWDIWTVNGSATKTQLTTNAASDEEPAYNPDGTKIAFTTDRDGNFEIYTMNADGTGQTRITNNAAQDVQPSWSPDGTKIAFVSTRDGNGEVYSMNADGTAQTRLTINAANEAFPAWSPDGTKIAFQSNRTGNFDIYTMNTDGTAQTDLTNNSAYDELPDWWFDGSRIYFDSDRGGSFDIYSMKPDGTNVLLEKGYAGADFAATGASTNIGFSHLAFTSNQDGPDYDIFADGFVFSGDPFQDRTNNSANDEYPDYQALNNSYARPKGASPLRIPFVPAYTQCAPASITNNTHHRGSINNPSCNAPKPSSNYLTVGSPDFNGQGANMIGSLLMKAKTSAPVDGTLAVSVTDVRCQGTSGGCSSGALSDYTDNLLLTGTFRITDKGNGPTGIGPSVNGTVNDLPLSLSIPCASTVSTTVGSTCSVNTTLNSVYGATAIVAGQRAIWQLIGETDLWDGGADGVATTTGDNTLFATGGLFFP
jgi:hypothetical protein